MKSYLQPIQGVSFLSVLALVCLLMVPTSRARAAQEEPTPIAEEETYTDEFSREYWTQSGNADSYQSPPEREEAYQSDQDYQSDEEYYEETYAESGPEEPFADTQTQESYEDEEYEKSDYQLDTEPVALEVYPEPEPEPEPEIVMEEVEKLIQIEPKPARHFNASMNRLGSGFSNVVFGPLELLFRLHEEMKAHNPVRGLLPGLVKGMTWFGAREAVGIFEIGTFGTGQQSHLPEIDIDWLHV
jgi:putative exosortase-associated protein (TIGR04073 family)